MLLIQWHKDSSNFAINENLQNYYNKIYENENFYRPVQFWELPVWACQLSYMFEQNDIMPSFRVFKHPEKIIHFYSVFGSVMDVNKHLWIELIKLNPTKKFYLGGYVDRTEFYQFSNVVFLNSLCDICNYFEGLKYFEGISYKLFKGVKTIPRLTMSTGCKHKCKFCTIENFVKPVLSAQIIQQVEAMKDLIFKVVYINDKTFGQCDNFILLSRLYKKIKSFNPDFKGFIIQTTANHLLKLGADILNVCYAIELGIETYNNHILKAMNKPHNEALINKAINVLKAFNVHFIPNIIVGLPGETKRSYLNTLNWLNTVQFLHINLYNLAIYNDSKLNKIIKANNDSDINENEVVKSYNSNAQNRINNWALNQFINLGLKNFEK